jgi:hypothetical protein
MQIFSSHSLTKILLPRIWGRPIVLLCKQGINEAMVVRWKGFDRYLPCRSGRAKLQQSFALSPPDPACVPDHRDVRTFVAFVCVDRAFKCPVRLELHCPSPSLTECPLPDAHCWLRPGQRASSPEIGQAIALQDLADRPDQVVPDGR